MTKENCVLFVEKLQQSYGAYPDGMYKYEIDSVADFCYVSIFPAPAGAVFFGLKFVSDVSIIAEGFGLIGYISSRNGVPFVRFY